MTNNPILTAQNRSSAMDTHKITTDMILSAAAILFRAKGYHETSMNEVAKTCKISVPCLHHYFLDKEALALAVMTKVQLDFDKYIFKYAYDKDLAPATRLANLNSAIENFFSIENSGCVYVNFVIEAMNSVPCFAGPIYHYFRSFSNAYREIFISAFEANLAQSLADDFVSDLQGALIMTRVTGTTLHLRRLSMRLFRVLESDQISLV